MYSNDHQPTEDNSTGIKVQRSLSIGAANDPLEHEAESMADRVMHMPESSLIQRKCTHCEEEEMVQRKPLASFIQKMGTESGSVASQSLSSKISASRGNGSSLDNGIQSFMQNRFGADFSNINIHTGTDAIQMSQELNARAFTVGSDIYFNEGQYNTHSSEGKHLLAHELTHTIQQGKSEKVQKSCSDGACDTCAGGRKDFWVTVFFRRRATERTMATLRTEINEAKRILANCCLNLKFDFNWDMVAGSPTVNAYTPATATDRWRFTGDETALGTGNTFARARGVPMLVVDDVPLSGGGVTVDTRYDPNYRGRSYFIWAANQTNPNPRCNHLAHELSHIGGIGPHDPASGAITACTGNGVSDTYCNGLRAMV